MGQGDDHPGKGRRTRDSIESRAGPRISQDVVPLIARSAVGLQVCQVNRSDPVLSSEDFSGTSGDGVDLP